jgi:hypothetical protein
MRARVQTIAYPVITFAGLLYAFYRGYLFPLPERLSTFNHWQVGDWLIDYSGGIVRRGLTGEVFLAFTPEGSTPLTMVVLTQTLLAAALYVLVGVLYWRTQRGPAWMMLVLSPAFLLFPALDSDGNTRKELIALIALAIAALGARSRHASLTLWIALPIFTFAVFGHEALVVTLPAFVYLALTSAQVRRGWLIVGGYFLASGGAALLAILRPGTPSVARAVCETWNARGINDCGGALEALGMSASDMTRVLADYFPGYWAYLLPAALALLPFFALRFLPGQRLITMIVIVAVLPLFFIGWDYGRWIFLAVAQLSLIALARPDRTRPMQVPLYGALAFILLWGFNHAGQPTNDGLLIRWMSSIFG